jgi:hypothetical protein
MLFFRLPGSRRGTPVHARLCLAPLPAPKSGGQCPPFAVNLRISLQIPPNPPFRKGGNYKDLFTNFARLTMPLPQIHNPNVNFFVVYYKDILF